MGADFDLYLACGALVVAVILFGMLLKRTAKVFNTKYARLERKVSDVAVYLSHINEDKAHLELLSKNKIDQQWAVMQMSGTFSDYKKDSAPAKSKIRIMVSEKRSE